MDESKSSGYDSPGDDQDTEIILNGAWYKFDTVARNLYNTVLSHKMKVCIGRETILEVKDFPEHRPPNKTRDPKNIHGPGIDIDLGPTCVIVLHHREYEVKASADLVSNWVWPRRMRRRRKGRFLGVSVTPNPRTRKPDRKDSKET